MSVTKVIGPHLPYLRRFARALTGRQASGDAYVVATLEALVADQAALGDLDHARIGLYKIFVRIWQGVPVNGAWDASGGLEAHTQLETMTPRSRLAFLLTAVEGFSAAESANIIGVSDKEFAAMNEESGREIADQIATDVLIIEDEPIIAMDLEQIVTDLGHRVIGMAATHRQAVEMASQKRPGLILADIQLADGSSGLDAVNELLQTFEAPVIFITAYPERFLTGTRPEPAFLVTKPFHANALVALISQALFFKHNSRVALSA